jgi:NitT/TauT family transport system substrate-binding protein
MAVAPKDMTMLVVGYDALPNYVRLCLTMTGKTVSGRREDTINFVAAEMDALKFTLSSRDDTIKLTQDTNNYKPDDLRPAYVFDDTVKHHAVDATIVLPMDKLAWMQDELVKAGNLKEPIDLTKITDTNIRAEVAKRTAKQARFLPAP